jgi:hypothetical protein
MTRIQITAWEIGGGIAALAAIAAPLIWLALRKKPTAQEVERARRAFLVQMGRLVDGQLLDCYELESAKTRKEPARTLTLLVFSYRIGGVDYECSQDITDMGEVINVSQIQAGFPCTVRYQSGNPQNSIVVAEGWTGLRHKLPALPPIEDPDPLDPNQTDLSHLRPGRG